MPRPRTIQELVHWLELGGGVRWVGVTAVLLGLGLLSWRVAWTQFHGIGSEATLVQADVGRQLARGAGFTTLVNYPQTAAFLKTRNVPYDPKQPYPELYQAPFYSMVIAGSWRVMQWTADGVRHVSSLAHGRGWSIERVDLNELLFGTAPVPPGGFAADYFLLVLNVVLLWLAAWLIFDLARRIFDFRAGCVAVLAMMFSVGIWQQTVTADGSALLMALAAAAFWIWARIEQAVASGQRLPALWTAALGVTCGCLFLTEYTAGSLVIVALAYAGLGLTGRARGAGLALIAVGFAAVAGPWVARNLELTGNPVGLAAQNVALKSADPTAEPATVRNTLSAAVPEIDLNKLGNKTLTELQQDLKLRIWSGGAMWFAAFFVAGWLYAFRSPAANRLRWIFTAALAVLLLAQASLNSGESERLAAGWLAPLVIVFGAGFFLVLLGSNPVLSQWPRACAAVLLAAQSLPLAHDVLEPARLHFHYPPYFPGLFIGMRRELERRDLAGRFSVMADVPGGVAWYGQQRVWAQPVKLRDFYAISLEQPIGELLLTPQTLDRPFFSELDAQPVEPNSMRRMLDRFGEWGRVYSGLLTGYFPPEFPLKTPQKLAENLYVMLNPALPPAKAGK